MAQITIWRHSKQITFEHNNYLDVDYYLDEGYTEITREEFDKEYVKAVKKLNKFAAL